MLKLITKPGQMRSKTGFIRGMRANQFPLRIYIFTRVCLDIGAQCSRRCLAMLYVQAVRDSDRCSRLDFNLRLSGVFDNAEVKHWFSMILIVAAVLAFSGIKRYQPPKGWLVCCGARGAPDFPCRIRSADRSWPHNHRNLANVGVSRRASASIRRKAR